MLRRYSEEDCEDVLSVWEQASAIAHHFLSEEFQRQERVNIANNYLPAAETWVWEEAGKVVGFISLIGNEIGGIFVDPTSQRSGIGKSLVGKAMTLKGELEVEVFERNRLGRAFYAGMGFEFMHKKIDEQAEFEVLRLRLGLPKVIPTSRRHLT